MYNTQNDNEHKYTIHISRHFIIVQNLLKNKWLQDKQLLLT